MMGLSIMRVNSLGNELQDDFASDPLFDQTSGAWGGPVAPTVGFANSPVQALASGVPQIGQDASPGTSLYDLIGRALQVYQLDRQQRAFLETNRELILQGRNPISWDQFQPTASVGVALDSGTKKILIGLGVGALLLGVLAVARR